MGKWEMGNGPPRAGLPFPQTVPAYHRTGNLSWSLAGNGTSDLPKVGIIPTVLRIILEEEHHLPSILADDLVCLTYAFTHCCNRSARDAGSVVWAKRSAITSISTA